VVVVGGTVVVVVVLVVEDEVVVGVEVEVVVATVEDGGAVSSPTARIDAATRGFASAPPASWKGPSPNSTTSATVTPTATPKRFHCTRCRWARDCARARRVTTSSVPGPTVSR
jgi:hypothetical protein